MLDHLALIDYKLLEIYVFRFYQISKKFAPNILDKTENTVSQKYDVQIEFIQKNFRKKCTSIFSLRKPLFSHKYETKSFL